MPNIAPADFEAAMKVYQDTLRSEKAPSDWAATVWKRARNQGVFDTDTPRDLITREQAAITYLKAGALDFPLERAFLEKKVSYPGNHITLAKLKAMGFTQIHDYYAKSGSEEITKLRDCVQNTTTFDKFSPDPVIARHLRPVNEWDVKNLNMVFTLYGITTTKRKALFFSQLAEESGKGSAMCEQAETPDCPFTGQVTRSNLRNWFEKCKSYGYKYRGAGSTHLTWKDSYKLFSEYVGDADIFNYGCEHVAFNYPWLSAGWFWDVRELDNKKINAYADALSGNKLTKNSNGTYNTTTTDFKNFALAVKAVTGGSLALTKRADYYNEFLDKL